mgnify:CR=1 FL=1
MIKYLCVAEKPSISKSITHILSGGQFNSVCPRRSLLARQADLSLDQRNARHPAWIKNYDFSYRMAPTLGFVDFTVTAVAGHLTCSDFGENHKAWNSCDPFALFDAPIIHFTNPVRPCSSFRCVIRADQSTRTGPSAARDCSEPHY